MGEKCFRHANLGAVRRGDIDLLHWNGCHADYGK